MSTRLFPLLATALAATLAAVIDVNTANAQEAEQTPPPADTTLPPAAAPAPEEPPPAALPVATTPQDPNAPVVTPVPEAAPAPQPTPEAAPAPQAAPPPAEEAAPVQTDECRERGSGRQGLLNVGLPSWAGGAIVGATVGAIGLSAAALVVVGVYNLLLVRNVAPALPDQAPSPWLLILLALPAGGIVGGLAGGVAGPFLPGLGMAKPCFNKSTDPTLRQSGTT
ncbi:MAG: hypothetical protein AB2A00_22725 [Myxococcota bacterium]